MSTAHMLDVDQEFQLLDKITNFINVYLTEKNVVQVIISPCHTCAIIITNEMNKKSNTQKSNTEEY